MSIELTHIATEILAREAHHLDNREWRAWLDLYTEDAVLWAPAWKSELETTQSPDTELSLIYLSGHFAFQERIWRVDSGLSVASIPMPRTTHLVTNVLVEPSSTDARMRVHSNWSVHVFQTKRARHRTFFGSYVHTLSQDSGAWRISNKKVILKNDVIPAMIDFYCM